MKRRLSGSRKPSLLASSKRQSGGGRTNIKSRVSRKSINPVLFFSFFFALKSSSQSVTVHLRPRLISYGRDWSTLTGAAALSHVKSIDSPTNACQTPLQISADELRLVFNSEVRVGPVHAVLVVWTRSSVHQSAHPVCKIHNFFVFMIHK